MEEWIDPIRLEKSEELKNRYIYLTNRNISNLVKKDFLKNIAYPKDSKVNKDFKEYLSILNKMGEHLKL
jgi:hypothetical protein